MIKPTVQTTFTDTLSTLAEQRTQGAEQLVPFSAFKLLHVKHQLSIMLSLIEREKLFDQYTRHDITHINELLQMVDWVVPKSTRGQHDSGRLAPSRISHFTSTTLVCWLLH